MRRFFRSPWAAMVLLLASPGLSGVALDAAHPCPVRAPWTLHQDGHHQGPSQDGTPAEHHDCKCLGSCNGGVSLPGLTQLRVAVRGPGALLATLPPRSSTIPRAAPAFRLPPSTAPPLSLV